MDAGTKSAEARRILERYLVEVVERWQLCPWARTARSSGELAIDVLLGTPPIDAWIAAGRRALGKPGIRVAMVVAPELVIEPDAFHRIRNRVAAATHAGVADFHPQAALDLATPARLVPYLRRSPDPMLQLVPLEYLASVRSAALPDRAQQAHILGGHAPPPRDVVAEIAAANHTTVTEHAAEIEAVLADIAADRASAYR